MGPGYERSLVNHNTYLCVVPDRKARGVQFLNLYLPSTDKLDPMLSKSWLLWKPIPCFLVETKEYDPAPCHSNWISYTGRGSFGGPDKALEAM